MGQTAHGEVALAKLRASAAAVSCGGFGAALLFPAVKRVGREWCGAGMDGKVSAFRGLH